MTVGAGPICTDAAAVAIGISGGCKSSFLPVTDLTKAIVCAISASRSAIHFMVHPRWDHSSKAGRPNQEGVGLGIAYFSRPPDSGEWMPKQTIQPKPRA